MSAPSGVIVVAGSDPGLAGSVADQLTDLGRVVAMAGDESAAAELERTQGVSALVVLPSDAPPRPLTELEDGLWEATVEANVSTATRLCRAAVRAMVSGGGGTITLVTSHPVDGTGLVHAAAVAGAVEALARALAWEVGEHGIRVNAVAAPRGSFASALPALRLLLSEDAGYVTGEVLAVGTGP